MRNLKFKECTKKYKISESLHAAIEHLDISLNLVWSVADGADSVWNDIIHDAMDLQDSRKNMNDPVQAIYEVL